MDTPDENGVLWGREAIKAFNWVVPDQQMQINLSTIWVNPNVVVD